MAVERTLSRFGRNFRLLIAALFMFAVMSPFIRPVTVFASGETITGTAPINGTIGSPVPVPSINIDGSGNDIISLRLYVSSGLLEFTNTTGLTFTGSPTGQLVQVSAARNDLNIALDSLQFTASTLGTTQVELSLTGPNQFYNPDNGHVYEVVNTGLNWSDANTAASNMTAYGANGYLATITSSSENDFVWPRLTGDGWFGANDLTTDNEWFWETGPETGTQFWNGTQNGSAVGGQYTNWNPGVQPDNAGSAEHCGQIYAQNSGRWNDLPCSSSLSYIVEYGASGDMPAVQYAEVSVTISASTIEVANCPQLEALDDAPGSHFNNINLTADIDCEGATIDSLFQEDSFRGSFDGNGFTIRNVVIDGEDSSNHGIISNSRGADFQDLYLDNISVVGEDDLGALVGDAENGSFTNIHGSNLTITADGGSMAGGLIGDYYTNQDVTFSNLSTVGGVVNSEDGEAGGLIGYLQAVNEVGDVTDVTIDQVYSEMDIISDSSDAGGLIGELSIYTDASSSRANVTIQDTYAWGDVDGLTNNRIGGLIGQVYNNGQVNSSGGHVVVRRSYARGHVTGSSEIGGLIGTTSQLNSPNTISISNSFAMGQVTANDTNTDGGLIGLHDISGDVDAAFANNYYDQGGTGLTDCESMGALTGCTAVNIGNTDPSYFINNKTNDPMSTWDFNGIWIANPGIPPIFGLGNDTDLNIDEIPDSQQPNVGGYTSTITGRTVAIDVGNDCELTTDDMVRESQLAVQDAAYEYDNGLWDFEADCGALGYTTTIKLYYYDVTPNGQILRKHNPTNNSFFTINDAIITTATSGGKPVTIVSYQVTDGGDRDTDGRVDGKIKDPAGLAQAIVGAPKTGL